MTELSRGFAPVVGTAPAVLILGSLPGRASIAMGQYYAQPRNCFWRIMGELCAAGPELSYDKRIAALRRAGVALWDVLEAAERPGSLDSAIVLKTARVNDVVGLLARRRRIRLVCCNGRKAGELYRRRILPALPAALAALPVTVLPSTSPAFAAMRYEEKRKLWQQALQAHLRT